MNRIYKTVWSEQAGTFVAVSENSKGRGKRSSSSVLKSGGVAAMLAAGALLMNGAAADVVIPEGGNEITFNAPGGRIVFSGGGGSITGLSALTVSGTLNANQIVIGSAAALNAASMQVVSGGQLFQTNQNVTAAQTAATAASTAVSTLRTQLQDAVTTSAVNAGAGTLTVASRAITVGANTTVNMGGNKIVNVGDGQISEDSNEVVTGRQVHDLFFETGAGGVRYFHANSTAPDSIAQGMRSIAIGPQTVSAGASSIAAGDGSSTSLTATGAVALGQGASAGTAGGAVADGAGSVAIGRNSSAGGTRTLALGDEATVEDERVSNAIAMGTDARVTGMQSDQAIAIGASSRASAENAMALGFEASASGVGAVAMGNGAAASAANSVALGSATATAENALAAGTGAYVATADSVAFGRGAGVGTEGNEAGDRTSHIAIGTLSGQTVIGNQDTSIGYGAGSRVTGDDNIAVGTFAGTGISGNNNIAMGVDANRDAGARAQSIAIGGRSAAGSDSVALGDGALAAGNETLALGKDAEAQANGVALGAHSTAGANSVALGRNAAALSSDATGIGYLTGSAAPGAVVSVGNTGTGQRRRIVNVADGAQTYDAVNVGQLRSAQQTVANLVGGGVTVGSDGSFTGAVIEIEDTNGQTVQFTTVSDALRAVSSGTVNIVPADTVSYNGNGTVTVAAGTLGTDAVNNNQLNAAIAENGVKYFSVNTVIDANDDNDGATGVNAMAIGPQAVAGGNSSVAIGHTATVNTSAHNAVALGHNVSARAQDTTAIGSSSHSYAAGGIAIGLRAVSRDLNSIVIGTGAEADPKSGGTVNNAIVIGTGAEATADNGIAVGESALASDMRAVAQGYDAHATAEDALATGTRSRASGVSAQASGTDSAASGVDAQASGTRALATGERAIAMGTNAQGFASDGVAMGSGARSGLANPLPEELARNIGGVAIGQGALSDYQHALAVGVEAQARAASAAAFGDSAAATANNALAAGTGTRATAAGATALGQSASAAHVGSVALGRGAVTAAPIGTASTTVDKVTYNFAATVPVATVSVGEAGQERTITNVAAGRINGTSTDAINGSQLFQTNTAVTALGNNLDTAGTSVANALGGTSTYNVDTHSVTANLTVRGNNFGNVQNALTYVGQGWNASANGGAIANVGPGAAVDFRNTDGNIAINRNGTNFAFDLADDISADSLTAGATVLDTTGVTVGDTRLQATGLFIEGGPSVTTTGVNGGGLRVTNVAPGVVGTDAVNVNQLTALAETPLTFVGDAGADVVRPLGTSVNLLGGATGAALTDGNIGVVANGTDTLAVRLNKDVNLGSTGSMVVGNARLANTGLGVNDGAGNVTNVSAGLISVGANPTTGPANEIRIDANTGTIGGLTNRTFDPNNITTGQAATEDQLKSISERAATSWTVVDADGSGASIGANGQVRFEGDSNLVVAQTGAANAGVVEISLNDALDLGVNGSVTMGDTVVDNNGLVVTDAAGNITATTASGTSVTGSTGTTTMGAGLLTVAGGSNAIVLNGETGRLGGLTNTSFDPNAFTSGQAATEDQLKLVSDVANAGWSVTDADDNSANIGPNGQVRFQGDSNLTVAQTGADGAGVVGITLNNALDLTAAGSVAVGDTTLTNNGLSVVDAAGNSHQTTASGTTIFGNGGSTALSAGLIAVAGGVNTITVNGNAGTINGLTNTSFNPDAITSGQAATEDQLKSVSDIANAGWTVTDVDNNLANIGPNGSVQFLGDNNLTVAQTGSANSGVIEITLNNALDLTSAGSVTMGNTSVNNAGLTVVDADGNANRTVAGATVVSGATGTSTLGTGTLTLAGGSNSITLNGPAGTIGGLTNTTFNPDAFTTGQAATEDQLKSVSDVANAGWIVSAGGEGATATGRVSPGATVDFSNTDGNIGIRRDGTDLVFDLADDLVVANSVAVGNTVMDTNGMRIRNASGDEMVALNNLGLVIAGGPSVTVNGINAGGSRILNVAAGVDDTDAVNVSQLKGVQQNVDELGDRTVKYDGAVGAPKNSITLEGADGTTIRNVADGRIEAGSKDAVNGGQIQDMGDSIAQGLGGNSKFEGGKLTTELTVAGNSYNNVNDALTGVHGDLSNQIGNVENIANAGWNVTDASGNTSNIGPNGQVAFVGGNNVTVQQTGSNNQGRVEVRLNDDITVNSITAVKLDAQTITSNEIVINNGGPIINETGINMSGNRITNVANGVEAGDAVNVGQLGRVAGELQGQVNNLRNDLHRQDRKLSAGVAAAMATASLPQAYLPGKTMMGMAAGTWNGESGMAIGFSGITDNGKWVYKLSGNSTSRGDYGGAVGVGYQW